MCSNHTPTLTFHRVCSEFKWGGQNERSRRIRTNSEEKSSRAAYTRPAGLHFLLFHPKQPPWNSVHRACTSVKGPRSLAIGAGRPAPPVGLSPRAFAWSWFDTSNPLSFLFMFKFTLVISKIKPWTNCIGRVEISSWNRHVLSFISYKSTCLPRNTCLGSLAVLLIDLCEMMTWGCTSSKFKVLEVFISKTQNKATLVLSLPYTYSRAFTSFTYKFKPIAIFLILSSCKRHASEQLRLFIAVGRTRTRSSRQSPLCDCIKLSIPLKEKEKKHMNDFHASSS